MDISRDQMSNRKYNEYDLVKSVGNGDFDFSSFFEFYV